jgi:hypothetical protein
MSVTFVEGLASLTSNSTAALAIMLRIRSTTPGAAYGFIWNSLKRDRIGIRPFGSERIPPKAEPEIDPMALPAARYENAGGLVRIASHTQTGRLTFVTRPLVHKSAKGNH